MINKSWYLAAVFFSILSSLCFSFLPEIQLMIILFVFFIIKSKRLFATTLILFLCTNTYAIPDAVLRMTPQIYPSLYTKNIFIPIKAIDYIAVLVFFSSIFSFPKFFKIKGISFFIFVFFICLMSTVINVFFGVVEWTYLVFYLRGFLLAIGFFCLLSAFSTNYIVSLLYFSMFCWVVKMITMILFPTDHVIIREILGIQWKIFFAGDEYLSFGLISACIISLLSMGKEKYFIYKRCFLYCFVALILALIAQRKGSIPYFSVVFLMLFTSYYKSYFLTAMSNLAMIVYASLFFLFFSVIYPVLPELYQLAFSEYNTLYVSAVDSIGNMIQENPYGAFLGIGSMGLYKIVSLPEYADHVFSFGSEVGNTYRYAIWNIPFGRLIINVGIIGFFIILLCLIYNVIKAKQSSVFYILFSIIPFFGMYGLTPIKSIYIGFSFVVLYKISTRNELFKV